MNIWYMSYVMWCTTFHNRPCYKNVHSTCEKATMIKVFQFDGPILFTFFKKIYSIIIFGINNSLESQNTYQQGSEYLEPRL